MKKIAIVGIGAVGSTTAYNMGLNSLVDEIQIIDNNQDLAQAQAKDLLEGFIIAGSKTRVSVCDYQDLNDVDIICITASVPATKVTNRLDFIAVNQKVITDITSKAVAGGFTGIFVLASNPVDVMSAVCQQVSSFDSKRVIGSGTILDSARFVNELAKDLQIDPGRIEALCFGEHGESIVPNFSNVQIDGQLLEDYLQTTACELDLGDIRSRVINGGYAIFNAKGSTDFGIASALTRIMRAVLNDTNEVLPVTCLTSVGPISDVYLPVNASINASGIGEIQQLQLDAAEFIELEHSANLLKELQTEL